MDFAVPEHRFSVPGMREEQLHTVTSGTTPFSKLLSLFSDGGSTSQAPWSALERKGSGTSTSAAPKPALTAAQKQELAAANGRSQKIKRGQKRSSPSEDGTGACDEGAAEEEELDISKLTPEEREQLANADVKEAKRLRRLLRNRCSAQLARERRKVYISELEAKVAAHEQRIEELEGKLATTEQQNAVLRRIIRTMRPPEGAEPVPLPPVDAVRLRETAAAAAAAANAAADVGAAPADAAPGNAQPELGSQQGSPQLAQQMDVDQQQRQGRQNVPTVRQAMPQQVVPQMSMAPPAAIVAARSMRTATPEPPTPQLPTARQQQQEPMCQYHMHAQQQLSQQQQQQQQQQGVVPALPPLPPAPRPAQISMQQRVEHSMELGPFSVAYRASLEGQKMHQQKEQEEQQQQQRSRYQGPPPQQLQQQPQRQQRHELQQYAPGAGMQYDCDTSALFGRGALPVPIVPKSQLQQLLMQQQLQQEEEQRQQQQQQDQRMYAQSFSQGGNRMDVHAPHSDAQSHGNNSSSLHVVPTSSWRSHSRPSHSNPMPQQCMQQAKQYESYSFPGQYNADAVAQKYSDALGVVPKRHRSSHGSSRRARDVVHVVPDVGAMSFPPDELLAALLSA